MKKFDLRTGLLATTTLCGLLGAATSLLPTAAMAQDTASKKDDSPTEVVVTGSILRKKNLTSIAPLSTISAGDLEKRGVTTVESALQNVAGNNGGAMNNNWSAGGGFAAGASGLSLRGLTSNSTLVLVDGMRMAYYPLADDATRNFVDLNTIPDAIVDRVEVLQDGASSTYGADAIAGVVNVITKKNFQGFTAKATVGARDSGKGGGVTAISGTWGQGDLSKDGYNVYISGEYQKNNAFTFAQADAPWNTANQSGYCGTSVNAAGSVGVDSTGKTCRTNGIVNGIQFDDTFAGVGSTTVATVRPYDATNTNPITGGVWQLLNPTAGCGNLTPVTITANEARRLTGQTAVSVTGAKLCQLDLVNQYNVIQPEDTRKSISARLTKRFDDTTEGYMAVNFYDNKVHYMGRSGPRTIQSVTTPGAAGSSASLAGIALPVYICPKTTVGACTSTNGTLNPNNPFASLGQTARINYLFGDIPYYVDTESSNARFAAGLKGQMMGWDYNLNATAMRSKLTYTRHGVPNLQHILDVVKDGSYNFVNPSQNTQAVRDYIAPVSIQHSDSEMVDLEATASRSLMDMAGGPLQLGLGASFRYERVNNPSANPDPTTDAVLKFNRYSNSINPFGAVGFRHVTSAFFELDAPLLTNWDVNLGGRVDSYSTKFAAFSPKIQSSYKVVDGLTLRGSFSKGFRAPSIAENNADPSTGFVTLSVPSAYSAAFYAAHGNDGYGNPFSYGKTTVAAKDLKPETSENTTLGAVWTPTKWLGFTADYYIISKHNLIQGGDPTPALNAYFAGQAIPAGFVVTPGVPDPLFPNALATPGYIQYTLVNINEQHTAGMDFSATARFNLGKVKWTTSLEGTYIQYYDQIYATGKKTSFAGTLGNNTITSGSGTPKLRYNWQNSFDFGKLNVSATAYYVSGYSTAASDNGDDPHAACSTWSTTAKYRDGATPVKCNIESFTNVDAHASYQITKNYTVTLDVLNLFDTKSPYDPSGTYGGPLYNPAFTATGIMGRYVKLTGKVTF